MKGREVVRRAQRIVLKIGSSTLTHTGTLRPRVFTELSRQISALIDTGRQFVLVSSGSMRFRSTSRRT